MNNDLTANYVLVSNIDCTGFSYTSSTGTFTGILNGQNHSIKNLVVPSIPMFQHSDGATIENINAVGGSSVAASFVEVALNSTFNNVHSSMSILPSIFAGGLVTVLGNGSVISNSSFTGTLSAVSVQPGVDGIGGGLVGYAYGASSITNSYSAATLSFDFESGQEGGIIGSLFDSSTINNVYSSSTIMVSSDDNGGNSVAGGLVGTPNSGVVANSFSASTMTSTDFAPTFGGIAGSSGGTSTNNFFDTYRAGTTDCSPGESASCTAENVGNLDPGYFKNNTSNGPFGGLDFDTIWAKTSEYPTLRSLSAFDGPVGAPNNGDSNNDGIPDSYQGNVASIKDAAGGWTTAVARSSTGCTIDSLQSIPTASLPADLGYIAYADLDSFTIYCPSPGMTVPVTLIFNGIRSPKSLILRHYNPTTHTYSTVPGVVFGSATIDGAERVTATYDITDGSTLDDDGLVNGVVMDPVGLATAIGAPNTGFGRPQPSGHEVPILGIGLAAGIYRLGRRYYGKLKLMK